MCSNWWCHDPNQPHRDHLLYWANFTPNELLDVAKLIPVNQPLTEWDNKRVFKTFWTIITMKKLRFWEFISYRKGDLWYKALTEWGKMWREIWSKITNLPQILTRSLPPFLPPTCPHSHFPPLGRSNFFWLPQITITLPRPPTWKFRKSAETANCKVTIPPCFTDIALSNLIFWNNWKFYHQFNLVSFCTFFYFIISFVQGQLII